MSQHKFYFKNQSSGSKDAKKDFELKADGNTDDNLTKNNAESEDLIKNLKSNIDLIEAF